MAWLMDTFAFDANDLQFNRDGDLSDSQRQAMTVGDLAARIHDRGGGGRVDRFVAVAERTRGERLCGAARRALLLPLVVRLAIPARREPSEDTRWSRIRDWYWDVGRRG